MVVSSYHFLIKSQH